MPKAPQRPLIEILPWEQYVREVEDKYAPDTIDLEDAIAMAQAAVREWAQRDYELCKRREARVAGVETKFIVGCSTGTRDLDLAFSDGSWLIADWKSAWNLSGEKLLKWFERLERSWQHQIYGRSLEVLPGKVVFEYRGVSRKLETASLPLRFAANDFANARAYLTDTQAAIRTLKNTRPSGPWPKNKPQGCGAYGRPCPEIGTGCLAGNDPPSLGVQLIGDALRYSHAGEFWLCPERYRRMKLRDHETALSISNGRELHEDAFEPPLLGTLLHAFMERVYKRIGELTI